jgi:hypothetical protein
MSKSTANRLVLLCYLVLAILLYFPLAHYLDCNDTLQYLVIAKRYAAGNTLLAINSYWGPLISWLLVPFIQLGFEPFCVLKLLQLTIGFAVLVFTLALIDKRPTSGLMRFVVKAAAVPLVLSFALLNGTPDLLMLCWLLLLLLLFSNRIQYLNNKSSVLLCALTGALMYFTKSIGLVFFCGLWTMYHLGLWLFYHHQSRRHLLKKYAAGLLLFALFTSPWVIALHKKFGTWSMGSSASYNFRIIGPAVTPDVQGELNHPFFMGKLVDLPQPRALNAWEEPASFPLPYWNPLHSSAERSHYLHVIFKNIHSLQSFNFGVDPGTVLLFGWLGLLLVQRRKAFSFFTEQWTYFLFPVVVSAVYLFVVVMHRYIWINDVMILVVAADLAYRLSQSNRIAGYAFAFGFAALVTFQSAKDIRPLLGNGNSNWEAAVDFSKSQPKGNCISLNSDMPYSYDYSSLICYQSVHTHYLGLLQTSPEANLLPVLDEKNVSYVFAWGNSVDVVALTKGKAILYKEYPLAHLKIFTYTHALAL